MCRDVISKYEDDACKVIFNFLDFITRKSRVDFFQVCYKFENHLSFHSNHGYISVLSDAAWRHELFSDSFAYTPKLKQHGHKGCADSDTAHLNNAFVYVELLYSPHYTTVWVRFFSLGISRVTL